MNKTANNIKKQIHDRTENTANRTINNNTIINTKSARRRPKRRLRRIPNTRPTALPGTNREPKPRVIQRSNSKNKTNDKTDTGDGII